MMTPAPTVRSLRIPTLWGICTVMGLCAVLHPTVCIVAQETPLVGRPTEGFYEAVGSGVKVAWQLDRVEVPVDEEIVATLVVSNVTNPQQVIRPDLKKLGDFEDRFVITDQTDPIPGATATEVSFSYRLRPRSPQSDRIPTLTFYYFNPTAPAGKQFKLTHTGKAVPIVVMAAKPKAPAPAVPLMEPEHLFAISSGEAVLARGASRSALLKWVIVGLAGPILALSWFAVWRWRYPDGTKLARINRSRAARRALDAIERSGRTSDPPANLATAVLNYLRTRFTLPAGIVTPSEVREALTECGLPATDRDDVAAFLQACDAARFSPTRGNGSSLTVLAEAMISRLEAA